METNFGEMIFLQVVYRKLDDIAGRKECSERLLRVMTRAGRSKICCR